MIPYAKHTIRREDVDAVLDVLRSGNLTQGPTVPRFETALKLVTGADHVVACSSGTAALHLAYASLGVGPGWRVLVPAVTFTATAAAAIQCGAEVVLVDVDPVTGLAGPEHFVAAHGMDDLGSRAVWAPVHLRGEPCDMRAIKAEAMRLGALIVEDACHALGAKGVGKYADAVCYSFHPAKHVACGEGGAVTFRDQGPAHAARCLRDHGRSGIGRIRFPGFNYRLSDIHAALGLSQLGRLKDGIAERRRQAALYDHALRLEPAGYTGASALHLYTIHAPSDRDALRQHLRDRGIGTQVHYRPLHHHPAYAHLDTGPLGADWYGATNLSLPLYPGLSEEDQGRVINAVNEWVREAA